MRCIADAMGHFDGARIRTYVMLLVERRATEQLCDEAAPRRCGCGGRHGPRFIERAEHTSGTVWRRYAASGPKASMPDLGRRRATLDVNRPTRTPTLAPTRTSPG